MTKNAGAKSTRPLAFEIATRQTLSMNVLTVFAKDPRLGHSKSRLARTIGDPRAFSVAQALLTDTLEVLAASDSVVTNGQGGDKGQSGERGHGGEKEQGGDYGHARVKLSRSVFYTPDDANARARFAALGPAIGHEPQRGDTLGQRLANCFSTWFDRHASKVIVIGTDCPTLGVEEIGTAFDLLGEADVVLGPAADGGYYLIGLSSPQPDLFDGIDWGGPDVLTQTVSRIRTARLTLRLLPVKCDLDTIDDLRPVFGQLEAQLAAMSPRGQATYWTLQDLLSRNLFDPQPFEIVHFDEIEPVACPCGQARRAFAEAADFPATVHQTEITLDAKPHFHNGQTEVYVILECDEDAALELNGQRHPVRVGSAILIRPGCVHRALGRMKVTVICTPKFDHRDEYLTT